MHGEARMLIFNVHRLKEKGVQLERVLITGGAGFIGSHLADLMISKGYAVRAFDSLEPQVHGPSGRRPAYLHDAVELVVGDVRDAGAVDRALEGCSMLVHFAAAVGVGLTVGELLTVAQGGNGLSQRQQLDFASSEYGQRFQYPSLGQKIWSSITYTARVLATDLYAGVVGQVGEVRTFGRDLRELGTALFSGDLAGAVFGYVCKFVFIRACHMAACAWSTGGAGVGGRDTDFVMGKVRRSCIAATGVLIAAISKEDK